MTFTSLIGPSVKSNSIKIKWIIFRILSLAKEELYFHSYFLKEKLYAYETLLPC